MAAENDIDIHHSDTVDSSTLSTENPWAQLKESHDPKVFTRSWLQIQSRILGSDVVYGLVVLGTPDKGPFEPSATWPDATPPDKALIKAIENTITQRDSVVLHNKTENNENASSKNVISCPLIVDTQLCGAVVFEVIDNVSEEQLHQKLEQLIWGAGWLEVNVHRNKYTTSDRLVTVLELIATSLHHERFQASATAVATELAGILGCERVAIGFLRGQHAQVRALSHSASFGKKANLIRHIEAAMDEAIDQHSTVLFPAPEEGALQVTRSHEILSKEQDNVAICTIPLTEGDRLIGAMLLERSSDLPFDNSIIQLCQHTASLLGPLLDVKRKDDRWIVSKIGVSIFNQFKNLIGPRHTGLKLTAIVALMLILFFSFATGDYRVTADARLEGTVQRSIAVPVAGYVVEATARAGDIVNQGDILFILDDKDLRLEKLKWIGQKLKSKREHSEAMAKHNRAKASVLSAQIEQADTEIALLDEQLKRTRVAAPFDSFIVSGDLSQSLGAPVERGDVLFEVAPLDSYRVILNVDERDIDDIKIEQTGRLSLTSAPDDILTIVVEKITPLSTSEEGRNFFRVEARLEDEQSQTLRPGMEGVGKILVDERKYSWIWTHKITHWFKVFFWSWWP